MHLYHSSLPRKREPLVQTLSYAELEAVCREQVLHNIRLDNEVKSLTQLNRELILELIEARRKERP